MEKIAVKELAYFYQSSGDLTVEFFSNHDMEEGSRAHDFLQSKYKEKDISEYYIKQEINILNNTYLLHGFIDGVLLRKGKIIIEEIKSTTSDLDLINLDYHKEHLAQAKIYAYLYALQNEMDNIDIRLTYISIIDYETKSFDLNISKEELEDFTFKALTEYIEFNNKLLEAEKLREKTIKEISFPFKNMRHGQKELMKAVYDNLNNEGILYAIAPTGIGKTMATLFSSLKALKKKDKLFYTTAKGSGKNAPLDAIKILKNNGLKLKVIDIVAKRKICNKKAYNCNPDECPFAKGYFDRLKAATKEAIDNYDIFDMNNILEITNKHNICAFEFSLYLSYFCDVIIADYNYVFDPHAHLIRYFEDDTYHPKVLVDEAHNLISRSKEMYSGLIESDDIRNLRKLMTGLTPSIRTVANKALAIIEGYREKIVDKAIYVDTKPDLNLDKILHELLLKCDEILEENKNKKIKDKDKILEIYFKIMDFNNSTKFFKNTHRLIVNLENDNVIVNNYCLDASEFILDTIKSSIRGIVLFSATLYPIKYHADLLTCGEGKYLELPSPFNPNNLNIIINKNISTKYNDRELSIDTILESIETLTSLNPGNYIVFFPSYQYLKMVEENIVEPSYELIVQKNNMTDQEKNDVIDKFKTTTNNKVGLFVLGGTFSEGIDFIGDSLSGVIIVGVGLPLVCDQNNISKDYFEEKYQKGFDYAYRYPGFTKVIQAVGRVIRTMDDKGVAILLDERFVYKNYVELYPPHWQNINVVTNNYDLKRKVMDFYNGIQKNK